MKGILQTFYKKPKSNKVFELSDGVLVALYEDDTFSAHMGSALEKVYKKYGETRQVLVVDVGAHGGESWMTDILPGVLRTSLAHLGPYYLVPSLSSVFEVCADAYDWLKSGYKAASQRLVLIMARNELCEEYRPLTAMALVASAYLAFTREFEDGLSALEHFKKRALSAGLCTERQLKQDTHIPSLYQYIRFFTMLRINEKFPNIRPLRLAKVLVQGSVQVDDQPWNPIVRIYQAGREDIDQCTTLTQKDNGLGNDTMIGTGYASFVSEEVLAGDVIITFEHWVPISDDTTPIFAIAHHTGFMQPPYHRVLIKDVDFAPCLTNKISIGQDFGVDLFFEHLAPPEGVSQDDFSDAAMGEYANMLGNDDAELIGQVADLYNIVEEIVRHAPDEPPPHLQAIAAPPVVTNTKDGGFVKEIREKFAEREKNKEERLKIFQSGDVSRKAKLLEEVFGIDVGADAVDEFVEVYRQYNEEVGSSEQGNKLLRQQTAKNLLDKTFMGKRSSPHQFGDLSSEDDGFGDIARYIDEEELDEIDVLQDQPSCETDASSDTDRENEDHRKQEQSDTEVLHNAVQVLLRGVKKSGRTERFRADDVLKMSADDAIDESTIIEQITGALQALVFESKNEGQGGSSRKYFSTQEVVDKVSVMRHEANPTGSRPSSPPPPAPPGLQKGFGSGVGVPPPPPPPPPSSSVQLAGSVANAKHPPPPPPPPSGSAKPPKGPSGSASKTPPPPPPPPPGSAKPPTGPSGPASKTPPPPPPPPGSAKPPTGPSGSTPKPPAPPPPPGKQGGGGPPPPPPPPFGGKKSAPPVPPPMGKLNAKRSSLAPKEGTNAPGTASLQAPVAPRVQQQVRNDTKRLNWNPISNMKVTKTLYGKQEFQDSVALDDEIEKDLLEKFSNRPPPKAFDRESSTESAEEEEKGPKSAGILDQTRTMNILIMLRRFMGTPKEIAQAVSSLDPLGEKLSFDNVNALYVNSFKPEELEMAKNYAAPEADVNSLNHAEALAYHVARIPRWAVKVKTMVTMRTAADVKEEIHTSLNVVIKASNEVMNSKRLEKVLASVLAIGNFLNAGTAKGSARGFRLEALPKLCETKAQEGGINLLHYITDMLAKKNPDALTFPEDMPTVVKAKRVSKEDVARELNAFQRAVAVMGQEITTMVKEEEGAGSALPRKPPPPKSTRRLSNLSELPSSPGPTRSGSSISAVEEGEKDGDSASSNASAESTQSSTKNSTNMLGVARSMYTKAESTVAELVTFQEEMLRRFSELAIHFGEDPKNAKVEEIFSILHQFMNSSVQSVKENEERRKQAERKERIAKLQAEDQEKRRKRTAEKEANRNENSQLENGIESITSSSHSKKAAGALSPNALS